MEKITAKNFRNIFLRPTSVLTITVLTAAILLLSIFTGSGYSKSAGPIPLSTTFTQSDIRGSEQSGSSEQSDEWQSVQMKVTAYCPCSKCCGSSADGITASNHRIEAGDTFAAADRKYPFGTKMIIPGYDNGRLVEVLDRGGAITGNHIDVFFPTHEQARQWGVKYINVSIKLKTQL
jgi:3D (Asp-Asp-Asp) domain-containing protein